MEGLIRYFDLKIIQSLIACYDIADDEGINEYEVLDINKLKIIVAYFKKPMLHDADHKYHSKIQEKTKFFKFLRTKCNVLANEKCVQFVEKWCDCYKP